MALVTSIIPSTAVVKQASACMENIKVKEEVEIVSGFGYDVCYSV